MRSALSVLVMLAVVCAVYLAMWVGWRNRGRRQADVPPLAGVREPGTGDAASRTAEGRYYGTTVAGRWMDRVVVHGLGVRSPCTLRLTHAGLDVLRGALSFFVARADLVGARRERGIAGKVVPPDGILVVTWRHGDAGAAPQHTFDSGFRLTNATDHDEWVTELSQPSASTPGTEVSR